MRARFFILFLGLLMLPGCKLFPLKEFPFEIRASIEGEIKGHKIHCEKSINLGDGKWAVMCGVGNDTEIKYRVRPLPNEQSKLEFLVAKSSKEGQEKIIAAPTLIVKRAQKVSATSSSNNSNILVMAERIK
jgi:hypothetical protein